MSANVAARHARHNLVEQRRPEPSHWLPANARCIRTNPAHHSDHIQQAGHIRHDDWQYLDSDREFDAVPREEDAAAQAQRQLPFLQRYSSANFSEDNCYYRWWVALVDPKADNTCPSVEDVDVLIERALAAR